MALCVVSVLVGSAWGDWPQYLGPDRNGKSPETGLLHSWPVGGPKVLWTVQLGPGYGGPAVSEGKVYLLDRIPSRQDVLRCFDLNTGKELWHYAYDAPGKTSHPGSRSVPAIDGSFIYTCGPFGHVHCLNKATHKVIWKKNVWTDFGGHRVPTWAVSQNPLVYKNLLILASQTPKAGVVAYDKKTGRVAWASPPLPGRTGYTSPTIVNIQGKDHLVMITALHASRRRRGRGGRAEPAPREVKGGVFGMDPKTGKRLWSYDGWQCRLPIPNVTAIGDGRLFVTGGYDAGCAMIKVSKKGTRFVVTELFKTDACNAQIHSAILHKGFLYANSNSNSAHDGMMCLTLDGKVTWQTGRSPNYERGGLILADGLIFALDGSKGTLHLVKATPDGYAELGSAKLLQTSRAWAPLALSDGKLLIRDQKQMKCVLVR